MCEKREECHLGDECEIDDICSVVLEVWDGMTVVVKDPRTNFMGDDSNIVSAIEDLFQQYRDCGREDWIVEKSRVSLLEGKNIQIEDLLVKY